MKIFQYALIRHPKGQKAELIVGKLNEVITTVLAEDIEKAKVLAARDIPDEFVDYLDEMEIAIRPF